ncbi:MAG: DNA primase [Planctomycetia bacterium]
MSNDWLDTKEQVRQATDIVDLVGSYVSLRRQGRSYVARCPWHDDTKPSLNVDPERQTWKCWVCDIGGDVFSFIMQAEGVEFREALEILAERAGIPLQQQRRPKQPIAPGEVDLNDRKMLLRAAAWAEEQYHRCLLDAADAEPARTYLAERNITAESIQKFRLGFAPNQNDWILRQAQGDPTRAKVLEAIGILTRRNDGTLVDRFRGRVLFSIRDTQGNPVGLGGRVLPQFADQTPAKYLNSPETRLFTKSKLLYGLDIAKAAMQKNKTALVMEGYTDTIMAHQFGFDNAVAVLGTALGEEHVKILRRFTDHVILVLDGDEAGQRRANQVLELFLTQNVDLKIVTLPEGLDPCDFLQEHGADGFRELLADRALDALEHAYQTATAGVDLESDIHGASVALEQILATLAKMSDDSPEQKLRLQKTLNRLAHEFRIPEEDIRRRYQQLQKEARRAVYTPRPTPSASDQNPPTDTGDDAIPLDVLEANAPSADELAEMEEGGPGFVEPTDTPAEVSIPKNTKFRDLHHQSPTEAELVELIVLYPELLPQARQAIGPEQIFLPVLRMIYQTSCRLADEGKTPDFDRLMLEFDDPTMKNLFVEISQSVRVKDLQRPDELLDELIARAIETQTKRQDPNYIAALKDQDSSESQKQETLQELMERLRARHGISEPKEGPGHDTSGS